MVRRLLPDFALIVLLAILCGFFFWRLFPRDAADSLVIRHDTDYATQNYNYAAYQFQRFREGELFPLWNPYHMAGSPFLADPQASVVYPPRWILFALAGEDWDYAWFQLETVLHFYLASLFTYLLVRRITERQLSAFIAAIAFTYGGYLNSFPVVQPAILNSSIWLPLVLLGVHEGTRRAARVQIGWFIVAGIALALTFLGGNVQTALMVGYLAGFYALYRLYLLRAWLYGLAGLALFGIVAGGLVAVVALPTAEYLRYATRLSDIDYVAKAAGYAFQNVYQILWTTSGLVSYWYIGVGVLVLAVLAGLYRAQQAAFWLGTALIAFVIGFGGKTALFQAVYVFLPGVDLFQHYERILLIFALSVAVLAGIGVQTLTQELQDAHHRQRIFRILGVALAVIGVNFLYIYTAAGGSPEDLNLSMAGYTLLLSTLTVGVLWWVTEKPQTTRLAVLAALLLLDLFSANQGGSYPYMRGKPEDVLQTPPFVVALREKLAATPFVRVDTTNKLDSYSPLFALPDVRGIALTPLRLGTLERYREQLPLTALWELLAVRYVVTNEVPPVPAQQLAETYYRTEGEFHIYELENPRPLAIWMVKFALLPDDEQTVRALAAPDFPLREAVILTDFPPFDLPAELPADATVTILEQRPELLRLTASSSTNGMVFIALPYYVGWQAEANGQPVPIMKADGGLMALPLTAGDYEITLRFAPDSFQRGLTITTLTLIGTLVGLVGWVLLLWRERV